MGFGASVWRGGCVGSVLGLAVAAAWAQDLPPPAERIQRQAENPLRWIIEAGKFKARPKAAEPPAPSRVAAAKPAARPTAVRPPERALAAAPAASVPAPAAVADATQATALAAPAAPAAPADPVVPAEPSPAEQRPPEPPVVLELLDGAEPSLPDDVDATLQSDAVLELAILVLADGTVGAVTTLASSHPAVDDHAIAAVSQWRFKPVPQAVVRHVELVFHPRR